MKRTNKKQETLKSVKPNYYKDGYLQMLDFLLGKKKNRKIENKKKSKRNIK